MENDIVMYAASYAGFRLAILAAFGYAFYRVLRPKRALATVEASQRNSIRHANSVLDDRC